MAELQGDNTDPVQPQRRPWQFSLRALFVLTTASAVILSASSMWPYLCLILCVPFSCVALPAALTSGLIYGRGYVRTFCIAALLPSILSGFLICVYMIPISAVTLQIVQNYNEEIELSGAATYLACYAGIPCGASLAIGLVAVGVRWIAELVHRRLSRYATTQTALRAVRRLPRTLRRGLGISLVAAAVWIPVALLPTFGLGRAAAAVVALVLACLPVVLLTALVCGCGRLRTFCVGALFPAPVTLMFAATLAIMAIQDGISADNPGHACLLAAALLGIPCGMSLAAGWLALGVRRLVERPSEQPERPSGDASMPPGYRQSPSADRTVPQWHCHACGEPLNAAATICETGRPSDASQHDCD